MYLFNAVAGFDPRRSHTIFAYLTQFVSKNQSTLAMHLEFLRLKRINFSDAMGNNFFYSNNQFLYQLLAMRCLTNLTQKPHFDFFSDFLLFIWRTCIFVHIGATFYTFFLFELIGYFVSNLLATFVSNLYIFLVNTPNWTQNCINGHKTELIREMGIKLGINCEM